MGGDESRSTRLRWLDAARYVVATVVTALTIAVIAWAIVQFRRPEVLYLRVASGYVTMNKAKSMKPPPVSVNMSLMIKAINPGGRAAILYSNISVHFLYNNSSEITYFYTPDIWEAPQIERDEYISTGDEGLDVPEEMPLDFVGRIFKKHEIKNTTVRLEGWIQTQTSALNFTASRFTVYHCYAVTIGTSPHTKEDDVPCSVG